MPFLLLPSCSTKAETAQLFLYTDNDPFMDSLASRIESTFKEKGISLISHNASRKQSLQNSQFVSILQDNDKKPVLLNIYDRLSANLLIEKAENEDTPLLFFNREPLLSDTENTAWAKKNVYYVGTDAEYEGQAEAEIAADYFQNASSFKGSKFDKNGDGKLQVAILRGELSHQDALSRTKYSTDTLRKLGFDVDLIKVAYCDWQEEKGYEEMRKMMLEGANIELLLSNNDAMAVGAVRYLKTIMKEGESFSDQFFPIIGVDGTEQGKKCLEEGYMIGTVFNDATAQAEILSALYTSIVTKTEKPTFGDNVIVNGNFYKVKGTKIHH